MIFVLVLAIAIALMTRTGRAAAIKRQRLTRIVPALGVVCVLALIAVPVLAVLTVAGFRDSDSTASVPAEAHPRQGIRFSSWRTPVPTSAGTAPTRPAGPSVGTRRPPRTRRSRSGSRSARARLGPAKR